VDISGWTLGDAFASTSDSIPAGSIIPSNGFLIIVASSTTAGFWVTEIPGAVPVINILGSIGNGLSNDGDALYLHNAGTLVDALSYGTNTSVFSPAAPDVADGHSLFRTTLTVDTDTAADWAELATSTPGTF
jgi:hypothetical protein